VLVDAHVHLNNYHEGSPVPTKDNCRRLLETMDAHGVDHAIVLTSYRVNCDRPSVQEVLDVLAGNPRITVVEGLRWSGDDAEDRTDLFKMEQRIRQDRVEGIKLYPGYDGYPIDEPELEAVHRMAAKHDVPVLIHTGDTYHKQAKVRQAHPLLVDDVAVDHPDVDYVMCHLGNPWLRDTAEVLYKNDNVYADISGLVLGDHGFPERVVDEVKETIQYIGDPSSQLLYGSDWPLIGMGPYLEFFGELELSEDERECVAWRNADRLFDIGLEEA
jgi:predicted TIM-barrel fold metal-dependent hydrolase